MRMADVFVVTSGCYSDYRIVGIFSTRDLAEAFLKEASRERYSDYNDIDVVTLDSKKPPELRPLFRCDINILTGEITNCGREMIDADDCHGRGWAYLDAKGQGRAESTVSMDHCDKLAIELRQRVLREIDKPPLAFEHVIFEESDHAV